MLSCHEKYQQYAFKCVKKESYKAAAVNTYQRGPAGRGLQDTVEWVRDSFIGIHVCTGGDRIRGARSPWEKQSVWQVNVERSRRIRELNVRHRQRSRVLWIDIKLGCLGELY